MSSGEDRGLEHEFAFILAKLAAERAISDSGMTKQDVESQPQDIETLQSKLISAFEQLSEAHKKNSELSEKNSELLERLNSAQEKFSEQAFSIQKENAELKGENRVLREQLGKLSKGNKREGKPCPVCKANGDDGILVMKTKPSSSSHPWNYEECDVCQYSPR